MKLCGLTGGVGMGKSTAAGFFLAAGARVVDTDEIAHDLVRPGEPALAEIAAAFGKSVIAPDGELRRGELAKIVFAEAGARQKLEGILHPRIRECWQGRAAEWRREGCTLGVVVIPLLFETQAESSFERIVCVACSAESQRVRLAARGWTPEQIGQRIAAQMPVEQKMARSHFVLWTEGVPEVLRQQIGEMLGKI